MTRSLVFLALAAGVSLSLAQTTTGPCPVTGANGCDRVRIATTCFASIGMGGGTNQQPADVYKCVDDEDAANAKKEVSMAIMRCTQTRRLKIYQICECYGCDTALEAWVKAHNDW